MLLSLENTIIFNAHSVYTKAKHQKQPPIMQRNFLACTNKQMEAGWNAQLDGPTTQFYILFCLPSVSVGLSGISENNAPIKGFI